MESVSQLVKIFNLIVCRYFDLSSIDLQQRSVAPFFLKHCICFLIMNYSGQECFTITEIVFVFMVIKSLKVISMSSSILIFRTYSPPRFNDTVAVLFYNIEHFITRAFDFGCYQTMKRTVSTLVYAHVFLFVQRNVLKLSQQF